MKMPLERPQTTIGRVLGRFQKMRAELEQAVEAVRAKQAANQESIREIEKENQALSVTAEQANKAIKGLGKVLEGE